MFKFLRRLLFYGVLAHLLFVTLMLLGSGALMRTFGTKKTVPSHMQHKPKAHVHTKSAQ